MKKRYLLAAIAAMTMLAGCGDDSSKDTKEQTTQETADNKEAEDGDEMEALDEDSSQDAEEEDEADMSEDLTMTTLKSSAGTIDYTSLEGLELEAGGHIAVVVKSTKTGYWVTVKKGMEAAVKDLNKKLVYANERLRIR